LATAAPLPHADPRTSRLRLALSAAAVVAVTVLALGWDGPPLMARAALIAGLCLVLWLGEVLPPFVPTLVLWALTPLLLAPLNGAFQPGRVLGWSAEPVLALFLGGFALGAAAGRHGLDAWVARLALRLARGRRLRLLALTAGATAALSMWMSNIAAAAMMLSALRPLLAGFPADDRFRRALLLGIALGANFGGIATPIGSGPNAIAIAAIAEFRPITFVDWMTLALPLSLGLLAAGVILLILRFKVRGPAEIPDAPPQKQGEKRLSRRAWGVLALFALAVGAWLTEPLHGIPSFVVALLATAALFSFGLLGREDLGRIDWSTLLLIAGGLGLGRLLEQSGLVAAAAATIPWAEVPRLGQILTLTFASALLSALMSNTAAVTLLIPLAATLDPTPSTAVLIAIAASLGIPFVISTPPNAMVYGEGGVKPSDLLVPGLILMILGALLVSLTGPPVLRFLGIP
jgi:sodium-dependent dicarboxylate transporter 2/3/5